MSFHFLKGQTYPNREDNGGGTIVVDRFAFVFGSGIVGHVLSLSDGPWTVTVNGDVYCEAGNAIQLLDAGFTSTITIGSQASVIGAGAGSSAIYSAHATNIVNAGELLGGTGGIYEFGSGNFKITNAKTGLIETGENAIEVVSSGTHTIINAGTVFGNFAISTGNGIEHVTNYGRLSGGVFLGDNDDTLTDFKRVGGVLKNGVITGTIDLGDGNDTFRGGSSAETVRDGNGKDDVKLGGGADKWIARLDGGADAFETIDGGSGKDTYDASNAGVSGFTINLDSRAHNGFAANIADDLNPATAREKVLNFENAIGTSGVDTLIGNEGANALDGRAGNDTITGYGGADSLNGGLGGDTFVYTSLKDSGVTKATRDTIHDFDATQDVFNLQPLNDKLGGIISAFLGVNVSFTGHAGDLRAIFNGAQTIVEIDKDGDKDADFTVALDGHIALTDTNFMPT